MGTPAYVKGGVIGFESPEQAQEAFKVIKEWVDKANKGNLPEDQDGDYNIYDLELNVTNNARYIAFDADSSRYQNLKWQMGNLLNVCKPLGGIEYFDAPVLMLSEESIYWTIDDE